MKVCAIQLTSGPDWSLNLREIKRRIEEGAQAGATLIILPENAFLFNGKAMRALAEEELIQTTLFTAINDLSKDLGVWIIIGSHPSLKRPDGSAVSGSRVRQSCLVFSPHSKEYCRYDKIHLFDVNVSDGVGQYKESDFIEPGELNSIVINVDGLKVGLSICYDLRFPELYRELAAKGAELIVVPAAFTYVTGKAHWNTLLRARAIENQVFMIGVNQCGFHGRNRQTYGHSVCYSPWGDDLGQLGDMPDSLYVDIDVTKIQECKSSMPVLEHRRLT